MRALIPIDKPGTWSFLGQTSHKKTTLYKCRNFCLPILMSTPQVGVEVPEFLGEGGAGGDGGDDDEDWG